MQWMACGEPVSWARSLRSWRYRVFLAKSSPTHSSWLKISNSLRVWKAELEMENVSLLEGWNSCAVDRSTEAICAMWDLEGSMESSVSTMSAHFHMCTRAG